MSFVDSQGFFSYSARIKDDVENGTRVENLASIYFDYNSPIITNTVFHTVSDEIKSDELWEYEIWPGSVARNPFDELLILPNPAKDFCQVYLRGFDDDSKLDLQVFSPSGKLILRTAFNSQRHFELDVRNWTAGMYILKLSDSVGNSATGKLQVVR